MHMLYLCMFMRSVTKLVTVVVVPLNYSTKYVSQTPVLLIYTNAVALTYLVYQSWGSASLALV